MINYEKYINFEIETYEDIKGKSFELIEVITYIKDTYFQFLTIQLMLCITKMNGREQRLSFNESNLRKLFNMLIKREVQSFCISKLTTTSKYEDRAKYIENDEKIYPEVFMGAICDYYEQIKYYIKKENNSKVANKFYLSIAERVFNNNIPLEVQQGITELFKKVFIKLNSISGFITYESILSYEYLTKFEQSYYITAIDASQCFDECLRGYYWGSIFTQKHISALGGLENIKLRAPCYNVDEIDIPNGKAVFLQLTEDINRYSDVQLRELRNFLLPLFPKKEKLPPMYSPYEAKGLITEPSGYISRILPEDQRQVTDKL